MTLVGDTNDLNASFKEMQEKSRTLNDSLKTLATEGLERLAKSAAQSMSSARGSGRRENGEIVASELSRLLRQELSGGIQGIFGDRPHTVFLPRGEGMGGGISVIVNNNSTATVAARETTDSFDRKSLEITIDQMVADSLLRGRQTSGVMRTLFGLTPGLMGR